MRQILITGGAGFIGSHLADELLRSGYRVRVLDTLLEQVHGSDRRRPPYLDPAVELMVGDICDKDAIVRALQGVDNLGTAVLLEALVAHPVQRLVVASSMSLYGEGLYRDSAGQAREAGERTLGQLRQADWELHDEQGGTLIPVPTPESKGPALASIYALSRNTTRNACA